MKLTNPKVSPETLQPIQNYSAILCAGIYGHRGEERIPMQSIGYSPK